MGKLCEELGISKQQMTRLICITRDTSAYFDRQNKKVFKRFFAGLEHRMNDDRKTRIIVALDTIIEFFKEFEELF